MFKHKEPGPLFSVAAASKVIARNPEGAQRIANQIRRFAQNRFIEIRRQEGSGRTASNLFAVSDLAVAKINNTLLSLGFSDRSIGEAVHSGCYLGAVADTDNPNGHPITDALLRAVGQTPANVPNLEFRLEFVATDTGEHLSGRICEAGQTYEPYGPAPEAAVIVPMRSWLSDFANLLETKSNGG